METENAYTPKYRDKIDINFNFNMHVNRCLDLVKHPSLFPDAVALLATILPSTVYLAVVNRRNEWNPEIEGFEYLYGGPIRLGTQKKPLMEKNNEYSDDRHPIPYIKDEDGKKVIDWDNENILSPRIVSRESPDYNEYFRIILEEAENAGLTWNVENTIKIGKSKPVKPRKTPTRIPKK